MANELIVDPAAPAAAPAAAAPAPAPTPAPAAAPAAPAPMPAAASASSGSGTWKDAFKSINYIEVGFGALGVAALYYMIYYYRFNIQSAKSFQVDMRNKIDDMEMKLADFNSYLTKPASTSSSDGLFK
jgi:hypothetical protein